MMIHSMIGMKRDPACNARLSPRPLDTSSPALHREQGVSPPDSRFPASGNGDLGQPKILDRTIYCSVLSELVSSRFSPLLPLQVDLHMG